MKPIRFIFSILIPFIIFIIIMNSVINKEVTELDNAIYKSVSGWIEPGLTELMKLISFFGSGQFFVAFSLLLLLVFYRSKRDLFFCAMILINLFSSAIINTGLKHLIGRDRPDILRLIEIEGYSFPSGHSMVSMSFYGLLIFLCCRWRVLSHGKKSYLKYLMIPVLSALILMIGISRIYLGVHYFSDVIGGFSLGVLWVGVFSLIIDLRYRKKRHTEGERV